MSEPIGVVCCPIIGRDYFEEFNLHFIPSFMVSVSVTYKKPYFIVSELPLKRGDDPF